MSLTIWTNYTLRPEAHKLFTAGLASAGCRLLQSASSTRSVLVEAEPDPALAEADIAYGQPTPAEVMAHQRVRWLALSSAGYTRYERADFRAAMQTRGTKVTNASAVFADSCAQQILAAMLALARNLPTQLRNQDGVRAWRSAPSQPRRALPRRPSPWRRPGLSPFFQGPSNWRYHHSPPLRVRRE